MFAAASVYNCAMIEEGILVSEQPQSAPNRLGFFFIQ